MEEKGFTLWLQNAMWLSEVAYREGNKISKIQKNLSLGWGRLREDRHDCEGAKHGEFKNVGGGVYIFGKRIEKCANNIVSSI